ncbi:uncharacterized protein LOC120349858 [Nilaparvata lugens]|uniref:uncharacterized protein LOC120349858 n=1 Tax=Nilaparvata lugens TaxID=108931 RepID=UPI00193D1B77|nr:uncharacterized protein LOC120349858 [Nilaparvata lugens]
MMLTAAEFPGLEDPAMLDHPRILQVMPSMNLVEEPKATDTMPANDICELVTGTTHVNMMSLLFPEYEGMEAIDDEEDEDEQRFNIKLNASIPAHFTQMQIRGSEPPSWFPGYYVALPSKPDVMIERKYGNILEKVWEEVQPEFVRPSGGAAIIGS